MQKVEAKRRNERPNSNNYFKFKKKGHSLHYKHRRTELGWLQGPIKIFGITSRITVRREFPIGEIITDHP